MTLSSKKEGIIVKKLIVAHDIVGIGKVASTIALPLLSVCQIETYLLPTVLLSSHTGGFSNPYVEDYSHGLDAFLNHWKEIGIQADGLLIGYSRSAKQVQKLHAYAQEKQIPIIVDPIMGDCGKLYAGFQKEHVEALRKLCQSAELIFPNLTEAAFLTNTSFLGETYQSEHIEHILDELSNLGPKQIVLTGITFEPSRIGMAYRNQLTGETQYYFSKKWPKHFYGTGDSVSAILTAAYLEGIDLKEACQLVIHFLEKVLESTTFLQADIKMGLIYEPHLGMLWENMKKIREKYHDKQNN